MMKVGEGRGSHHRHRHVGGPVLAGLREPVAAVTAICSGPRAPVQGLVFRDLRLSFSFLGASGALSHAGAESECLAVVDPTPGRSPRCGARLKVFQVRG